MKANLQNQIIRFLTVYVFLYIVPIPLDSLQILFNSHLASLINLDEYLLSIVFHLTLSTVIYAIWSLLDTKRTDYKPISYTLQLGIRVFLFITMLVYGFAKVYALQFHFPSPIRLMTYVHELPPMRLLWIYMGYSAPYQIFTGFLEVMGGFFMLFRRTTTLGALITSGVMANVALMNFQFDIPVKDLSTHLLIFALILVSFDYKRVLNTFLINKNVGSSEYYYPISNKWFNTISKLTKIGGTALTSIALFAAFIVPHINVLNIQYPPLYGIYKVTDFTADSTISVNDYWRYLVIDRGSKAMIRNANDQKVEYSHKISGKEKSIYLKNDVGESIASYKFNYTLSGDTLWVTQNKPDSSLSIKMLKVDDSTFRLKN